MSFGLYIHVPFCERRCTYCDFDFKVGRRPDVETYLASLDAELRLRVAEFEGRRPETLYVGGGTPSLLGLAGFAGLVSVLARSVDLAGVAEFTVEVNPEHVSARFVAGLQSLGVDRISLGVQSFDPVGLAQLGRGHDAPIARGAIRVCRNAGVRTSVDLLVGWPGQTPHALRADVDEVLIAGVDHVSVYALTVEAEAPWPKLVRRGLRQWPDDDLQAERLAAAEAQLVASGFTHYEISNYGRGVEVSRHNQAYWTGGDYLGVGPSAASARYGSDGSVRRRQNLRGVSAWSANPTGADEEHLSGLRGAAEGLWLGLRCLAGVEVRTFLARFPQVDEKWLHERVAAPIARGDLRWEQGRIRGAPTAWLRHDAIGRDVLR